MSKIHDHLKMILEEISLAAPEVMQWMREYLEEQYSDREANKNE